MDWTVIGCDTLLGDPIFIDTATPEYAVYTAIHGAGVWRPRPVSPGLDAFIRSLSVLADFSVPSDKTQLNQRIEHSQSRLTEINGPSHREYWEALFQMLIDEIEEQE